jgi:hypothetical protein
MIDRIDLLSAGQDPDKPQPCLNKPDERSFFVANSMAIMGTGMRRKVISSIDIIHT